MHFVIWSLKIYAILFVCPLFSVLLDDISLICVNVKLDDILNTISFDRRGSVEVERSPRLRERFDLRPGQIEYV